MLSMLIHLGLVRDPSLNSSLLLLNLTALVCLLLGCSPQPSRSIALRLCSLVAPRGQCSEKHWCHKAGNPLLPAPGGRGGSFRQALSL